MESNLTRMREHKNKRILSAPIMINLELTSGCNMKCRHCYNYWRDESSLPVTKLSMGKFNELLDMIISNNIFHVVLTGGEPLLSFEVLVYALEKLHNAGISTSLNSNLMLATSEKMKKLKSVGLDHILTSLNSYHPEINDFMVNKKGAFESIVSGIKTAISEGVRVSANMIVSKSNKDDVYGTARLCSELGVQKFFGTRMVPSPTVEGPKNTNFHLDMAAYSKILDDLIRANKDFNIAVGSLISYPLCFLEDLEKYEAFVGRGCPTQKGNRMVINADGIIHGCTHEEKSYGNVFEIGIKEAFKEMIKWHDGSYMYEGCLDCDYILVCGTGCRSASNSYYKNMNDKDPLFMGPQNIKKHFNYKNQVDPEIVKAVDNNGIFIVPERLRFRRENGFFVVNVRWANAYTVELEMGEFLRRKQASKATISLDNMIGKTPRKTLIDLIAKEAVVPADERMRKEFEAGVKLGCSINPEDLPKKYWQDI